MTKTLLRILAVAALAGGVAVAQATSPQSTSPSQQTNPSAQQSTTTPDQTRPSTTGQSSTSSTASLTQAQSQIQEALDRQMSTSNVSVSTDPNTPNQLQLTGSVASQSEKQRAEDIARSAAPSQTVVDNIKVSGSPDVNPSNPH